MSAVTLQPCYVSSQLHMACCNVHGINACSLSYGQSPLHATYIHPGCVISSHGQLQLTSLHTVNGHA